MYDKKRAYESRSKGKRLPPKRGMPFGLRLSFRQKSTGGYKRRRRDPDSPESAGVWPEKGTYRGRRMKVFGSGCMNVAFAFEMAVSEGTYPVS